MTILQRMADAKIEGYISKLFTNKKHVKTVKRVGIYFSTLFFV
jgi:hypothetical protein